MNDLLSRTHEFIDEWRKNGLTDSDIIYRLVAKLITDQEYFLRQQGDGCGKIKEIKVYRDKVGFIIEGEKVEYTYDGHWRKLNSLITRRNIEDDLRVWPGYIDAIEDMFSLLLPRHEQIKEILENEKRLQLLKNDIERQEQIIETLTPQVADKVPTQIEEIKNIQKYSTKKKYRRIYFLCKGAEVVYIGQSKTLTYRIKCHKNEKRKRFDSVWFINVLQNEAYDLEKYLIDRYRPKYNIANNPLGQWGKKDKSLLSHPLHAKAQYREIFG